MPSSEPTPSTMYVAPDVKFDPVQLYKCISISVFAETGEVNTTSVPTIV